MRHVLQLILLSAHGEDGLRRENTFFLFRALTQYYYYHYHQ